jgi:phenazine biosynthesis protein phzE
VRNRERERGQQVSDLAAGERDQAAGGRRFGLADGGDDAEKTPRGPTFTGLQFHPESVLTLDDLGILRRAIERLLAEV